MPQTRSHRCSSWRGNVATTSPTTTGSCHGCTASHAESCPGSGAPRDVGDGTVEWLPWEGADFTDANWAVSDYLRLHHPVEYEHVCSPGGYEPGSIAASGNLALTGACAELWSPLSEDVARWIRAGKPDPVG